MEIQFENLVWKFILEMIDIWKFSWILGNLDGNLVWKLLLEIQFGKLVEILDRNLHRIFYPWKLVYKFTSEIQIEIQFAMYWNFSLN